MSDVNWVSLVSTMFGAAIALGGTVLADHMRRRDEHGRDGTAARKHAYLEFVLALGAGLQNLREVAMTSTTGAERFDAATGALARADVYPTREKFLMIAPPAVIHEAQLAFDGLIAIRAAVREGAGLRSAAYHNVYHPYAELMWRLRLAARRDLGGGGLRPADLSRDTWDDRAHCATCREAARDLA